MSRIQNRKDITGYDDLTDYGGIVRLPIMQLVFGEIGVAAKLIGTYTDPASLVTLAGQGKVMLHPAAARWKLDDAIDDVRHGRIHGRAILICG